MVFALDRVPAGSVGTCPSQLLCRQHAERRGATRRTENTARGSVSSSPRSFGIGPGRVCPAAEPTSVFAVPGWIGLAGRGGPRSRLGGVPTILPAGRLGVLVAGDWRLRLIAFRSRSRADGDQQTARLETGVPGALLDRTRKVE
jgi:hypothetical protein